MRQLDVKLDQHIHPRVSNVDLAFCQKLAVRKPLSSFLFLISSFTALFSFEGPVQSGLAD